MPAPPEESLPAMVSTAGSVCGTGLRGSSPHPANAASHERRSSHAAARTSSLAKIAETTAAPAAPVPASSATLSGPTPPIATTGMSTAAQMARRPCRPTAWASVLVAVGKTAPTPR